MRGLLIIALVAAIAAVPAVAQPAATLVAADPKPDVAYPAGMEAFVLPSHGADMNAVLYTASGAGPHPTLLLLHGFPGNEQNLDLAQAARRAGWNVLTMHYRGSWGSRGSFSFSNSAEDAHIALAFLRSAEAIGKYRIDPARIAVAGHSMGGFMAADAAADDPKVVGLFLIDAWDISATGRSLTDAANMAAWRAEVASDVPPLAGTSVDALTAEIVQGGDRLDLRRRIAAYGKRPLAILGADRGGGADNGLLVAAARTAGNAGVEARNFPTDHSFSDHRIALASALVAWLDTLPSR